jgi:hypothetical protein
MYKCNTCVYNSYIHMYTHIHTHYTHIHTHTHTLTCVCVRVCVCVHVYVIRMYVCIIHTYVRTHTHARTHTHTHTHTHTQVPRTPRRSGGTTRAARAPGPPRPYWLPGCSWYDGRSGRARRRGSDWAARACRFARCEWCTWGCLSPCWRGASVCVSVCACVRSMYVHLALSLSLCTMYNSSIDMYNNDVGKRFMK